MTNETGVKPLDGSVMLLERQIGQIAYYANQTRGFDLKLQPNLVKKLTLHFHGKMQLVSEVDLDIDPNVGPYSVVRNIQIRASNGVILKNIDPSALHFLNTIERASEEMVLGDNFGSEHLKPFSFDLTIPFENHTGFLPERTIMNTNEFSEIRLDITWGNELDMCFTPQSTSVALFVNFTCDIVALERVPLSMEDELLNRQRMVDTMQTRTVLGDNEPHTFDLPENSLIKTLLFYLERKRQWVPEVGDPSGFCRAPLHNGIVRARVEDNNGAHIIRDLTGLQIQSIMRFYFGLEGITPMPWSQTAWGGDLYTQKQGIYILEFDQLHDFTSLYSTIGVNFPKLVLDTGTIPAPPPEQPESYRLVLLQRQIITPASTTP